MAATSAPTAYQPTQASSSSSPAPVKPQNPAAAAAPASAAWSPNSVVSRHNAVVQRINNWGCCFTCVVRLEITKDSSKLGDIAKIATLALANLGLAFYDVAKGAFCMVKEIVTKVLCCYKKAAPAAGAPAQGAAPTTGGSTPPVPAQAGGSAPQGAGQPAPAQAGGSAPQGSGSAARAQSPAPQVPADDDLVSHDELVEALVPYTQRLDDHFGRLHNQDNHINALTTRLATIEQAFNQHIGINAQQITALKDSFAALDKNLGVVDNRGYNLVRAHVDLSTRLDHLEGVVQAKVLPFNPAVWAPNTSSSSSSTSPAPSSSSSVRDPSPAPALPAPPTLDAQIAELKKTPEGVQQLARMFSDLAMSQAPAPTTAP